MRVSNPFSTQQKRQIMQNTYLQKPELMNDLHRALLRGCRRHAYALIENGAIDINQCDEKGGTPLMYAAMRGYSDLVHTLLTRGAETAAVNATGFDALHASSMNGDGATVQALVDGGADLETVEDSAAATSLHMASQAGNLEVVKILVRAGAQVDRRMKDGETALYLAATRGHSRVVSFLLRENANPLLPCSGFTPLEAAAKLEQLDVIRVMLRQVGIQRCGGFSRGETSLICAAQQRNIVIMSTLCDAGAEDRSGSALCAAVTFGHKEGIRFLLQKEQGVLSLNHYVNYARDDRGLSPIQCCFLQTSLGLFSCRIVRMLLDAGADVNTVFLFRESIHDASEFAAAFIRRARYVSEDQVRGLEGVRRLVLQADATRGASWRWPLESTFRSDAARSKLLVPMMRMRRMRVKDKASVLRRVLVRCVMPYVKHCACVLATPILNSMTLAQTNCYPNCSLANRYSQKLDGAFEGYGSDG